MSGILWLFVGILIGYVVGRKLGFKEGEEMGTSYAPLLIRMESLKGGKCRICSTPMDCYKSTSMLE